MNTRRKSIESHKDALLKEHINKGLPPIAAADIDDLPFKIKIDEWEWQEVEGVGKFPKNCKPNVLDSD